MKDKRGQITIFIIIALIIVASVATFFFFKETIIIKKIPASIEPVYANFLSCLEDDALTGIDILESQAGYIYLPDFEPGSMYMPFSSQLDFLGNPIPYWYYISGNNIQKEQVPSKEQMQEQLEEFIEQEIRGCVLDEYYEQGFEITEGEPKARVIIRDDKVDINLDMGIAMSTESEGMWIREHKIEVKSRLGALYNNAKKIYTQEQRDLFLENYALDSLRLYAPVDGVELSCSPKIWNADEIFNELQNAIQENTLSLKTIGKKDDYFVLDFPVNLNIDNIRFLNSKDWPSNFEVAPSEESVLIANPVGNQPGLGILGFCYVPYHFVYNLGYPVLIQVFSGEEIFQFPVAVIVRGNKPREALNVNASEISAPELCRYKNTLTEINVYDSNLNSIDADIYYECFSELCNIGKTSSGKLGENFPQCVNGYIIAKADGFEDAKYLHSTTQEASVDLILDKTYNMDIELKLNGIRTDAKTNAVITFTTDGLSKTIAYPEQTSLELSEAQYEIEVYIYKESSLNLESTTYEQCVEVSGGLGGLFGITEKKCFDVEIPEQIISNALSGGGKQNYYILENQLKNFNVIEINSQGLPQPKTLEQLQDNYALFEEKGLDINFK